MRVLVVFGVVVVAFGAYLVWSAEQSTRGFDALGSGVHLVEVRIGR